MMPIPHGTRLGPYEILAPLGAGGMGEVYRARDTRLGRDVAVKVLPDHLVTNAEVRTRFEREARTISSLNHPHICTLHDVGREADVEYLVMELVEGETLAQRLSKGPLPTSEVLKLGIQIADALDRAHRAGIVHRDFKPGNVMLTRAGAKLMDFGLARSAGMAGPASGSGITIAALTQSPTVASPLTAEGTLVGTFLYMAPEQLEGREADARSDLWAFGCTLYEMATGRRAFDGKSQASLVGAIMNTEPPPISAATPLSPPALDGLVRACLAKDPEERIQTAHDVKLQLSWLASAGSQPGVAAPALPRQSSRRAPVLWGAAALALAVAGFLAGHGIGTARKHTQQLRFTIPVPRSVTQVDLPRISPDGRLLAFSARDSSGRTMIWVRPLNALDANPLPGTENCNRPFWSPDSRYLAFTAEGKLKKVPVAGGPPQVICDAPTGFDGTWGRHGDILLDGRVDLDPILRVKASGGLTTTAMPGDTASGVAWPAFLPDGRHYFYTKITRAGSEIMLGKLGSPTGKPLGMAGSRVEYSPEGYVLFARDQTLLAQRFDARRLKLVGEPFPVAQDLPVTVTNAQANFTVSNTGTLVYRATGISRSRLVWLDRAGRELEQVAGPADYRAPALSPAGTRIAVRRRDTGSSGMDIWLIEPARGTTTRFTFDPASEGNPYWSPDGSQIVWSAGTDLRIKSANGLGVDQVLVRGGTNPSPLDWTPDGKHVLYNNFDPDTRADVFIVPVAGDRKPSPLIKTPFNEGRARVSPDGRWLAYESDESGQPEIYVVAFQSASGKWQISTNGGSEPCWSRDGRELFYLARNQKLMSVPVTTGAAFSSGTPRELFDVRVEAGNRRNVYCPSPDGQRFLFQLPVGDSATPMTVTVNWRGGQERE